MPVLRRISGILSTLLSIALISTIPAIAAAPETPSGKEYIMGVFPHLPPRDLEEVFAPIAKDLGAHIGHPIVLASSTTFERFSESLDKQTFDIAFVQPFDYVRIAERYGYQPLATRTERLNGIVVTQQESKIGTLTDLKGKHLALPPETAAVSQLIIRHMRSKGLVPGRDLNVTHHRSHVSCMQQVMIGEADACGTAAPSVRFFEKKMHVDLKIIAETRDIPSSLFVAHPRVPEKQREQLRARIIDWSNTEEGKAILSRGELTPFKRAVDADYNVVRELGQ